MPSRWDTIMVYGSNELVQLANKDRSLVEIDVVGYIYPLRPNKDDMLRSYYNNVSAYSTSIWRLVATGRVPWMPKDHPKPLYRDIKTLIPRRLVAARISDLLPLYAQSPAAMKWWQGNLRKLPNGGGDSYLQQMIGAISRSTCVQTFIEYDAKLDAAGIDFMLKFHKSLGYPNEKNFYCSFATPVYLSNVAGDTLKDKAEILCLAPKHMRRRFALMNDDKHSLAQCVKVAQTIGCRVAVHATNFVKFDKGPINLKSKIVEKAKDTCRANKGSSAMGFNIVVVESSPKRLAKFIPAYAKHGNVVIYSRK